MKKFIDKISNARTCRRLSIMLIVVAFFSMNRVVAQNVLNDTIRWNSSGFYDKLSNVSVNQDCYFVTYQGKKIDWVQGNGSVITSFDINQTSGRWRDVSSDGTVTFYFRYEDGDCKIMVTRSNGQVTLLLDLEALEDGNITNEYKIDTIE